MAIRWQRIDWQEALVNRWLAVADRDERSGLWQGAHQWYRENGLDDWPEVMQVEEARGRLLLAAAVLAHGAEVN